MSDQSVYTILLCGVGGQGTITAADLLARVATAAGKDCKVSEIHGMAQRVGAVTTVVRFGDDVATMVCDEGCADSVVSFEVVEALRNIAFLKEGGSLVVNDESIKPLPVLTGMASMPQNARGRLKDMDATPQAKLLAMQAPLSVPMLFFLAPFPFRFPSNPNYGKKSFEEKSHRKPLISTSKHLGAEHVMREGSSK